VTRPSFPVFLPTRKAPELLLPVVGSGSLGLGVAMPLPAGGVVDGGV